MEDDCLCVQLGGGHPIIAVAGVFDGHSHDRKSGKKAATIARNNITPVSFFLIE